MAAIFHCQARRKARVGAAQMADPRDVGLIRGLSARVATSVGRDGIPELRAALERLSTQSVHRDRLGPILGVCLALAGSQETELNRAFS